MTIQKQLEIRSRPLMKHQWMDLIHGDLVELRDRTTMVRSGRIDEVTAAGTAVWVHLIRGMGRVMLHHSDDVEIWRTESPTRGYDDHRA